MKKLDLNKKKRQSKTDGPHNKNWGVRPVVPQVLPEKSLKYYPKKLESSTLFAKYISPLLHDLISKNKFVLMKLRKCKFKFFLN